MNVFLGFIALLLVIQAFRPTLDKGQMDWLLLVLVADLVSLYDAGFTGM